MISVVFWFPKNIIMYAGNKIPANKNSPKVRRFVWRLILLMASWSSSCFDWDQRLEIIGLKFSCTVDDKRSNPFTMEIARLYLPTAVEFKKVEIKKMSIYKFDCPSISSKRDLNPKVKFLFIQNLLTLNFILITAKIWIVSVIKIKISETKNAIKTKLKSNLKIAIITTKSTDKKTLKKL